MASQPVFVRALLRAPAFQLLARIALTSAYWWGGIAKLLDYPAALAEARHSASNPRHWW